MAFAADWKGSTPLGCFYLNNPDSKKSLIFEYSHNPELILAPPAHGGRNIEFPHRVWVTTPREGIDQGWRYACVKGTVVHIITDEFDDRFVVEKWSIKAHIKYDA